MPRKKVAAAAGDPTAPAIAAVLEILCPACKSKIGSDGKTLHEKSAYLEELLETEGTVDQIEKHIADRDATIADLRGRLAAAETQLGAANKNPKIEKEKPSVLVQNSTEGKPPGKKSWFD